MDVKSLSRTLTLTAALVAAAPSAAPAHWSALDAAALAELAARSDGRLEGQRAGTLEQLTPLAEGELSLLGQAQRAAAGLEEQRGGDVHLTDREVQIILWTAAVIAVVLLVA